MSDTSFIFFYDLHQAPPRWLIVDPLIHNVDVDLLYQATLNVTTNELKVILKAWSSIFSWTAHPNPGKEGLVNWIPNYIFQSPLIFKACKATSIFSYIVMYRLFPSFPLGSVQKVQRFSKKEIRLKGGQGSQQSMSYFLSGPSIIDSFPYYYANLTS